jgi:hypothetical protein
MNFHQGKNKNNLSYKFNISCTYKRLNGFLYDFSYLGIVLALLEIQVT